MALSQATSSTALLMPFDKHQFVGTSKSPITHMLQTTGTARYHLVSSFHTPISKPCPPLRTISCVAFAGASSDDGTREASSISSVFVKGLPDSVSEGRLKKVFSEFGEVRNVKIIINEKTRQSLGYGYVWFKSKDDAELAVEAMNGKVYSC